MKLPFKYIAILVIVSLAGIFAYQAYWLTGLYHTMHSEMERDITEAMRIFESGKVYNVGTLEVKAGETVYLEEGSVVCGCVSALFAHGMKILGNGAPAGCAPEAGAGGRWSPRR